MRSIYRITDVHPADAYYGKDLVGTLVENVRNYTGELNKDTIGFYSIACDLVDDPDKIGNRFFHAVKLEHVYDVSD